MPVELVAAVIDDMVWPAYVDYCRNVSPRTMAADIKPLMFLYALCRQYQASVVADFGSGFSSYMLRLYASMAPRDVTVLSIDDNEEWLAKTAAFLEAQHLSTDGLMSWADWSAAPIKFDVGFYDLASGETREAGMQLVTEYGDVVLFDDAQHSEHFAEMMRVAKELKREVADVRAQTMDAVGRFGLLVRR